MVVHGTGTRCHQAIQLKLKHSAFHAVSPFPPDFAEIPLFSLV